jgi:multimeric flavodoxin WrbA
MVNILALLGSARKGGNTDVLLKTVLDGAREADSAVEVDFIRLPNLEINSCLNCGGCDTAGVCSQKDEMQEIYEKLLTSDIILFASPIYFMGVSSWAKAMIDRCQALWVRKYRLDQLPDKPRENRKGVFLAVSGMRKPTVFDGARSTVKSFFATIHVTYIGDLVFTGIDAKSDLSSHSTALTEAKALGRKLITEFDNLEFRISNHSDAPEMEHDRK